MLVFFADTLSSKLISMSFLRVVVVVYPQMLSVALLCVCAVAFGRVSARSDSGNFLDDKWLTGRWDKFRDVSCIFGWLLFTPSPSSLAQPFLSTFIRSGSCAPLLVMSQRRVMGPFVVFVTRLSPASVNTIMPLGCFFLIVLWATGRNLFFCFLNREIKMYIAGRPRNSPSGA